MAVCGARAPETIPLRFTPEGGNACGLDEGYAMNTCRLCGHTWKPRKVTIRCPKCRTFLWEKPGIGRGKGLARTITLTGKGKRTADRTQAKADVRRAREWVDSK